MSSDGCSVLSKSCKILHHFRFFTKNIDLVIMQKILRYASIFLTLFLCLFYIFRIDWTGFSSALSQTHIGVVVYAMCCFLITLFISSLRLRALYKAFHIEFGYGDILHLSIHAQVGNLMSLFGVMAVHATSKSTQQVPLSTRLIVPIAEKIVMLIAGACLCACSLWSMYKDRFDFSGLLIIGGLVLGCIGMVCAFYVMRRMQIKPRYIIQSLLLSVCIWIIMASIYAAFFMELTVPFLNLLMKGNIISFVSSIPISLNGWGVREFITTQVFQDLNVSESYCVAKSVSIGIIAFLSLLICTPYMAYSDTVQSWAQRIRTRYFKGFMLTMPQALVFLSAAFICINIIIPINGSPLSLNLVDTVACFALIWALMNRCVIDKIDQFFIISMGAAFICSLIVYYMYTGYVTPHSGLKFIGGFIVLGYFLIGRAFSQSSPHIRHIFYICTITLISIIVYKCMLVLLVQSNMLHYSWVKGNFDGLAGNRNAFALQCLIVSIGVYSYTKTYRHTLLSFLYLGVILSSSRTAFICLAVLILLQILQDPRAYKRILMPLMMACIMYGVHLYLIPTLRMLISAPPLVGYSHYNTVLSSEVSNHERLFSCYEGIKMWLSHPLFGAGLGAFMQHYKLIIHNSILWLLAEFGIVGSLPFCAFYIYLVRMAWRIRDYTLLNLMTLFTLFSLVHEVMYQRIFWFALGIVWFQRHHNQKNSIITYNQHTQKNIMAA